MSVRNLHRKYNRFHLGPVDIELDPGEVLGFIGPNGAGKTTTINCIAGILPTTSGIVSICGRQQNRMDHRWKEPIGYLGEMRPFYEKWTVAQNLQFLERLYPCWSQDVVTDLTQRLEIDPSRRVCTLSKGNRVKLGLVAALAPLPSLLLLDEPSDGLDPLIRHEVIEILGEYLENGERSLFYSTHILTDISRLATTLAFIAGGKIVMQEQITVLVNRWKWISFSLEGQFPSDDAVSVHEHRSDSHRILTSDSARVLNRVKAVGGEDISLSTPTIEDISIAILKNEKKYLAEVMKGS